MTAIAQNHASAPVASGLFGRIGAAFQRMQENRARNVIFRQTVRELSDLTNRDLADLGINRSMINRIAHDAAWGDAK